MTALSTRELVRATGATARQVQWWCDRGLLRPASRKTHNGLPARAFTPTEVMKAQIAIKLRRKGFSLARVRSVFRAMEYERPSFPFFVVITGGSVFIAATARDVVEEMKRAKDGVYVVAIP